MERKAFVYILHYQKKKDVTKKSGAVHYTGWTYDVPARVAAHRAGTSGSKFTLGMRTRRIPFDIGRIYECDNRGYALKLEWAVKHGKVQNSLGVRCNARQLCTICSPPTRRITAPI